MNIADFSSAVQLTLRRASGSTSGSSSKRRSRSRSPIRTQLTLPTSSAVARSRSKSPSRKQQHLSKSLLDVILAAAPSSNSSLATASQRVTSPPSSAPHSPLHPVEPTAITVSSTQPVSPKKQPRAVSGPLRSNSPTLSYLILILALTTLITTPLCASALPLGNVPPTPPPKPFALDTDRSTTPTATLPSSIDPQQPVFAAFGTNSPWLITWFPKLWHSLAGTESSPAAAGSLSSPSMADPLESMVALFGPWEDDEWSATGGNIGEIRGEDGDEEEAKEHLDADEGWFHCGGKARFMAGLRKADGNVVGSAPKCPKSQSTSARVSVTEGNAKNRVHVSPEGGLPLETEYLTADTLRGTLLYSRPAMVTPHTEL